MEGRLETVKSVKSSEGHVQRFPFLGPDRAIL
jgi:hypothetical protein